MCESSSLSLPLSWSTLRIPTFPPEPTSHPPHLHPQEYKDDNHKPEMAVALSEFEALCSFVGHEELVAALQAVPELVALCGAEAAAAYAASSSPAERRERLRAAFTALMTAPPPAVAAAIKAMCSRLAAEAAAGRPLADKERLVLRLQQQYPNDVGVMAAWFLNYLRLGAGQAIALPANEPHAYISGQIVECMATSDNVVRAGLTPKFRDTQVLCASLTYSQGPPEVLSGGCPGRPHLACYRPPFREFEIWRLAPPAGVAHSLPATRGPMIMLVQQGSARVAARAGRSAPVLGEVKRGDVFFIPAGLALDVSAHEPLAIWFAAVNGMGLESQ